MIRLCLLAALATLGWSLYVRRHTWPCKWEIGGNLTMIFQAAALLLTAPAASSIFGPWLYDVTGRRNVEDFLGHCFFIFAAAATVYHALSRIRGRTKFGRHILTAVTVAFVLRLIFFARSEGSHIYLQDYLAIKEGFNTRIYWYVTCLTIIYILGYMARIMLVLRRHETHRATANVYLFGATAGILACIAKITDATAPSLQIPTTIWIVCCLAVSGFAYGYARSWTHRSRELVTRVGRPG